ncbi:hypothetical protein [Roseibium aggregatum]|uniref:Uncharacterized protein n=1 Tax=Roseibium aggregatum TaxID=187304 RepID=A0A939J4D8_9HYPH|nr:hypothetical protein [Roseibium aggregatum]MBN9673468.1 hypothetical protein [Roseibium aggregatum]
MPDEDDAADVLKWPTANARQKACAAFCAHIAAGYSIESFPDADRKTIRYYAEQFPEDFPPEKLETAARRGLMEWERIGKEGARGDLAKFNASAWAFNMKNRAGWRDRSEAEAHGIRGGIWGGAEEGAKVETFKPRSSQEIALGVMALLTREDNNSNDNGSGDTD